MNSLVGFLFVVIGVVAVTGAVLSVIVLRKLLTLDKPL